MFAKQTIWLALLFVLLPCAAAAQYVPIPDEPSGLGCPAFGTITDKTQCSGYKVRSDINNRLGGTTEIDPLIGYNATGPGINYNVQAYGAIGNDAHDDSAAFTAAINDCRAHFGGTIHVPPTGNAYLLGTGIVLNASGCSIRGDGGMNWPGPRDNVAHDWTQTGTWIHCTDTTNPCITTSGNGSNLSGLNFWYTQPTPAGVDCPGLNCLVTHNWTPTTYPFTILSTGPQNHNMSDIVIINATHCIDFEGTTFDLNDLYSHFDHLYLGCFDIGTRFHIFGNPVAMHDIQYGLAWYPESVDVLGWTEGDAAHTGHKIDWDAYWFSAINGDAISFFQSYAAIRATDASVGVPPDFGIQSVMLNNVQFNLDCQGIILAASGASGTTVQMQMNNVIVAADYQTSFRSGQCAQQNPYFFNLPSDHVDITLNNVQLELIQNFVNLGGGASGIMHIHNLGGGPYSEYAAGGIGFNLNAGAILDPPLDYSVNSIVPSFTSGGAGPRIVGATPTLSSGFGSTSSIVGDDSNGLLIVGGGGDTVGILNFHRSYLVSPVCHIVDETKKTVLTQTPSTTQLIAGGTMSAADQVSWQCKWFN